MASRGFAHCPQLTRFHAGRLLWGGEPLGQHHSLDIFPALLICNLGLIDEVLAPASTNKRPVPEWQCPTAKAKSSASTPTDVHVNERTAGSTGGLFVRK